MAARVDEKTSELITRSHPNAKVSNADVAELSSELFPGSEYSTEEKGELDHWQRTLATISATSEDSLKSLNAHLSTRTTILGSRPSAVDIAAYTKLAPIVVGWSDEMRTGAKGYHHIVRHADFVQNSPVFALKIPESDRVKIDTSKVLSKIPAIDPKAEKERKKKEKEAAAAGAGGATGGVLASAGMAAATNEPASSIPEKLKENVQAATDKVKAIVGADQPKEGKKKEKKEKQPKPKAPAAVEKPMSPALIDLRVGHILKAINHPNADSLYVSTIACGDPPGTENTSEYEGQVCRTVCSGLNGLVPLEEMQGRKIVAVCNLKPVTMRGIKSAAMVLAASPRLAEGEEDKHAGPVELVNLPAGAKAGDRVYFEGWEGEPEPVLNPKKKIWESIQPGFTTTDDLGVAFDSKATETLKDSGKPVAVLKTAAGLCTVTTLKGAVVR